MNPTETFPHVVARTHEVFSVCRCGRGVMPSQDVGVIFGDDCPAALREALATERALRERFEAEARERQGCSVAAPQPVDVDAG